MPKIFQRFYQVDDSATRKHEGTGIGLSLVKELVNLMGGRQKFVSKLDSVFTIPPVYDETYYRSVIHEIREMQVMNMGNYAHGNQPIQHMIYLYNYTSEPWQAQVRLRGVMTKLYSATPDGYSGDEDNGQTSAWYVFSALGFYPVTPGVPEYVIGSPLFNAVTLTLPQGKQLQINALNNQQDRPFVQALQLNGQPVEQNFLRHNELLQGGELRFDMSATPNTSRGVNEQSRPYSVSTAAEATTMADSHLNKDTH